MQQMKRFFAITGFLLLTGCQPAEPTAHLPSTQYTSPRVDKTQYVVLAVPPELMLDKMLSLYSPDKPEWPQLVDEIVKSHHPILRHAIRQLAEDKKVSLETARQLNERIDSSVIVPVDGQRVLSLMETACYADVMCHGVERPLRVATLDYVKANVDSQVVKDTLNWIRSSYRSGLPLDSPGDETGDFHGALVESMQIRLIEYATELLGHAKSSK